ncbi:disease resistance protein RUN1-like isoform X2 [Diospyros lotus]|uniref:disease resistance protein RUN1-like isoform X2 n=1 Tax=Diospyros lotus TaxID=55363 RepID=UPI002250EA9A|nr:disease resistance protein RUN1-like isoform X2 [Diospyros lotus]
MASTSTQFQDGASLSSGSSSWKYDVFLSFRGADTRSGFVDHLYSALHQKGIFTFKDDLKLERGESISPALLKAIEESRLALVIFSENYASSKWCLEELVKILECQKTRGLTVLPVFYKVDPSDLRKQRGSIGEAFARHDRYSNEEKEKQKVQRWRNALMEAANISGWDSENGTTHGLEAKLVREIVKDILSKLGDKDSSILDYVVGLDPRVAEVKSLLGIGLDDSCMVGICGMGGIGKTTIAKAVYNQICSEFDGSSYLANVRETSKKHGLESLQELLLSDILLDSDIKIRNLDRGLSMIMNRVRYMRVLIVLDDVDRLNQLEALVGKLDWFGSGSRIIITTRDSHLLDILEVNHVYNVKELNHGEALKLFCCKAFRKNQPTQGYEGLTNSVVHYAKGVPLALQVLGSFLFGRSIIEWRSAVDRLRQQPNAEIQDVLKLSYDGLDHEEKEIFLDIACFFKRKSKNYVKDILDACGFHADIGIRVLEDKALVTITHDRIDMHDLIQEMGCHIVNEESPREPGRRSRLWKYEDIYHTLTKKTGTETVEAIVLVSHKTNEISLSPDAFSKMSKLRLLKLSNVQLPNGLDYLSNDLRVLDWHGYPSKCLPSNFQPDSLVTLKMSNSCLKQPWNGRMVSNLKELSLEGMNFVEIHPSIEAIKKLMFLNLRDCKELTSLPSGICGLKLLTSLIVSGCSKLSKLPENLGGLERLRELRADFTAIKQPLSSTIHLNELMVLSFLGCKGPVTSTPRNSLLSSFLIRKKRQDSMGFELPALSSLRSIFLLDLRCCNFSDGFLTNGLGSLSCVRELYLSGSNIISLPASIEGLCRLHRLELMDCKKLKTLPYLPTNINCVNASGCTSLETLPDPPILPRKLGKVYLMHCHTLVKNRPSLSLELFRNYLKGFVDSKHTGFVYPKCTIVVPEREIPKWFRYQNNMGHYVGIQLKPDWYQRLRGFFVCAVFEAKAPSIYVEVNLECYGLRNDVAVYAQKITISGTDFRSDHLFLDYVALESFKREMEVNHLKTLTEIFFYFSSSRAEMFVPVKCAVHMVYEDDEERPDSCASIQQSDDSDEFQWKGSQSELSETSIQNVRDSATWSNRNHFGRYFPMSRKSVSLHWTDGRLKFIKFGGPIVL